MKKSGLALLALSLFTVQAEAQSIEAALKEHKVPAVGVGIIRDARLREVKVVGEVAAGVPAPYDTIFNVASLTKPVVAMLTLRLVSMGKWDLDEPLANYWTDPDVAADPRAKQLTTRHVLNGRFSAWVLNGAGLPPPLFEDMVKRHVTTKPNQGMGLGWEVLDGFPNGEYALVHSGSDRGVHALVILLPKSKQGIVLMTNGDNGHRMYERFIVEHLDLGKELMARAK